jgi:pimeloyl-ACP methyl ester carboxylesterase
MTDPMQRIALSTGVELDVQVAGDSRDPAVILLHGFPESHRTWRHQVPALATDRFVLAPDQRGYARSSKPEGVEEYAPDKPVADLLALADHFGIDRFTLVGHDWGGAIAWMAALQHPGRVERLIIINAPHPQRFQQLLYDNPEQRAASQYITTFRDTRLDQGLVGAGLERFLGSTFARHITGAIAGADKAAYLDEWSQPGAMTAMLNWYRASRIEVPAPDETPERPAWLDAPFPPVTQPTLVIWGMGDKALLPTNIEGLDRLVPDLKVVRIEDAGHFVPWEKPEPVTAAMREWLSATGAPANAGA